MLTNGGKALMKNLEAEGVEILFGLPGGAILPAYDPLIDSSMRHILVRRREPQLLDRQRSQDDRAKAKHPEIVVRELPRLHAEAADQQFDCDCQRQRCPDRPEGE